MALSTLVDMLTAPPSGATTASAAPISSAPQEDQDQRLRDLAEIIQSYNAVTEKLQRSHEVLQSEVLRLQEELAGKNAQLQRSKRLAALGEMAAGIAHEIRNPLAAIHLYARMLVEDLGEWEAGALPQSVTPQRETSEKIADAVRGLNAIVTDVLAFSREIKPRWSLVEAQPFFARLVDAHRPAIDASGVDVVIECDVEPISCDPELIHRALLNIVRNAVDAMAAQPEGRRRLIFSVAKDANAGLTLITVRDSGPGIEQADVDRIFNPFFTTRNTGTGLGLAIVHRIIDAHGGNIRAFNDDGAVFELRIPSSALVEQSPAAATVRDGLEDESVVMRRSA